jgi:hypothetical protein
MVTGGDKFSTFARHEKYEEKLVLIMLSTNSESYRSLNQGQQSCVSTFADAHGAR